MSIQTNRLDVQIHYDALFSDFDIFGIYPNLDLITEVDARKDIFYGRCLVDAAIHKLKAISSAYNNQAEIFLLFRKEDHINEMQFKNEVECAYPKFTARRLQLREILAETPERKKRFYYGDRVIVQLLVNALANPREEGRFHNISATLMHFVRKEDGIPLKNNRTCNRRVYLEFRITGGMYLKVSVATFQNISGKDMSKAKFVLDPKLHDLRLALPDDGKDLDRFEKRGFKNKRNNVDFLDFKNLETFRQSRAGYMLELIHELNEQMGKYLTVSFRKFEENTSVVQSKFITRDTMFQKIREHFQSRTIYVQNQIAEDGDKLLTEFEDALKRYNIRYMSVPLERAIPPKQPAVIILHPQDWYLDREEKDPYPALHSNQKLLQVITNDIMAGKKISKKNEHPYDPAFQTVLKELWIKEDVLKSCFTFPIQNFSLTKPWYFVYAVKQKSEKESKSKRKEKPLYTFYRMKLEPNGKISFDVFSNRQFVMFTVEAAITGAYDLKTGNEYLAQDEKIEGIMYCDENNLHKIVRTNWWGLPNLQNIYQALRLSSDNHPVSKATVLDALTAFQDQYPEFKDFVDEAKEKITAHLPEQFNLKALRALPGKKPDTCVFRGTKPWARKFSLFWFNRDREQGESMPVLLFPSFKTTRQKEDLPFDYGLTDAADIQTFTYSIPYLYQHQAIERKSIKVRGYLSGIRMSRMHSGYARGTIVRNIIPDEGMEDQSEEILPLLDVDFVTSNDMFSVLPFPFKYLREYAAYCEQHSIQPK